MTTPTKDLPDHVIGAWTTARVLARLLDVRDFYVRECAKHGKTCAGWVVERRPVTDADRRAGHDYVQHMYRAVRPESEGATYVLFDVVGDRWIPEVCGSKGRCRARSTSSVYSGGPPTEIVRWTGAPPELGQALRESEVLERGDVL